MKKYTTYQRMKAIEQISQTNWDSDILDTPVIDFLPSVSDDKDTINKIAQEIINVSNANNQGPPENIIASLALALYSACSSVYKANPNKMLLAATERDSKFWH